MFLGVIKRVDSKNMDSRMDYLEGTFDFPVIGESFILQGEPLVSGTKKIRTTPVQKITKQGNMLYFSTLNSNYKIYIEKELWGSNL